MSQHVWCVSRHVCPFEKKGKKMLIIKKKKEEILGNLVASQRARHFLLWQTCGFCLLKNFEKERDYDESAQSTCDTERRMNGHVKSMQFQLCMEAAASKCHFQLKHQHCLTQVQFFSLIFCPSMAFHDDFCGTKGGFRIHFTASYLFFLTVLVSISVKLVFIYICWWVEKSYAYTQSFNLKSLLGFF